MEEINENNKRPLDEVVATENEDIKKVKVDETTTTTTSTETPMATDTVVATTATVTQSGSVAPDLGERNTLVVFNLQKYMTSDKFQKLLKSHNVEYVKCKKVPNQCFGMVTLATLEMKKSFIEKFHGMALQGETLKVTEKASGDDRDNNNNNKNNNNNRGKKGGKDEAEPVLKNIADVVNPWYTMEYKDQLESKKKHVLKVLTDMTVQIRKECPNKFPDWLSTMRGRVPCCPFEEVVASPIVEGYRNKCSYTIGLLADGTPSVGFSLGRTGNGVTVVGDPSSCLIISKRSNAIRAHLEAYVRKSARLTFDKNTHVGFWRQLNVRDFTTGETMATIQMNHRGVPDAEMAAERAAIIEHFASLPADSLARVTSLQLQLYDGVSNAAPNDWPVETISGPEFITEKILDRSFQVSSNAFFQVNSPAAALLYSKVLDWAGCGERSIVLDVCCGTGTIGQCVSSQVRHVYGLEIAPDAVADAVANAAVNRITNVEYLVGKAEDTMARLLARVRTSFPDLKEGEIVGIVDPPRSGLHQDVIKALRAFEPMKTLVYVSCNQNSLIQDASKLCKSISNTMRGTPFRPVKSIAFDLFPHTEHCEVVVLFERITNTPAAAAVATPVAVVTPTPVASVVKSEETPVVAQSESVATTTTSEAAVLSEESAVIKKEE
eukprot:gene2929-3369_t